MAAGVAARGQTLAGSSTILALHSTSDFTLAALLRNDRVVARAGLESGRASIRLAGAIEQMLAEGQIGARDVGVIAVCVGPGSFTGIKVGLATAYGLAAATGAVVFGADSLEILAEQAPASEAVAAVFPAGRGDLYLAVFEARGGAARRQAIVTPRLATAAELVGFVGGQQVLTLGADVRAAGLSNARAAQPERLALDLAALAARCAFFDAGTLPAPVYLRRTWAEEVRSKRAP